MAGKRFPTGVDTMFIDACVSTMQKMEADAILSMIDRYSANLTKPGATEEELMTSMWIMAVSSFCLWIGAKRKVGSMKDAAAFLQQVRDTMPAGAEEFKNLV